jgi:hypothetical protein
MVESHENGSRYNIMRMGLPGFRRTSSNTNIRAHTFTCILSKDTADSLHVAIQISARGRLIGTRDAHTFLQTQFHALTVTKRQPGRDI